MVRSVAYSTAQQPAATVAQALVQAVGSIGAFLGGLASLQRHHDKPLCTQRMEAKATLAVAFCFLMRHQAQPGWKPSRNSADAFMLGSHA
jgi:hypothetical protein